MNFVNKIITHGRIMGVGCGNNSPYWLKKVRPDLYYIGIDIEDYNQSNDVNLYADEYIKCLPENFHNVIAEYNSSIDSIVSSHNLEHCNEPERVLIAMCKALKPGSTLYLSFPCEESVGFPKRKGSLNFFDDNTHQIVLSWETTLNTLKENGCLIDFKAKRYRPYTLWIRGLLLEPYSFITRSVIPDGSTWALYGFESVIWATMRNI